MKTILQAIINYRIRADMALSEVKDGVYTQKEYEEALKKIGDQALKEIEELLLDSLPENKKGAFCLYLPNVDHSLLSGNQGNIANGGYNKALEETRKAIKSIIGGK